LESVYRATYRGFKSLILRQNVGNPPKVISDKNSPGKYADSCLLLKVPIRSGH